MRIVLAILSSAILPASGAIVFGNFGTPDSGNGVLVGDSPFGGDTFSWAYRFALTGTPVEVDSINLVLEEFFQADGDPIVNLYRAGPGGPGSLVTSFAGLASPLNTTAGIHSFTPETPAVLAPNLAYWLSVTQSASGNFSWNTSDPPSDPGGEISVAEIWMSDNGGLNWTLNPARPKLQLVGTPIPEPAIPLLLGLGALLTLRRKPGH